MKTYPKVLTIAGSDSGGGAGIQADIKAISATGCYAASAITAVTVQNTLGVSAIHNIPADIVRGQISAVLTDIGADAVKIGMLGSAGLARTIAQTLHGFGIRNIVLDPVMVATSGDRLIEEDAVDVLAGELAPMARVITPNIPEAEILSGMKVTSADDLPRVAVALSEKLSRGNGVISVMMKAGHLDGKELCDWFYNAETGEFTRLPSAKTDTPNTHGTGCTLSSAFASFLAQGYGLDEAAAKAKKYITEAIVAGSGYTIGHGHGPVDHFYELH